MKYATYREYNPHGVATAEAAFLTVWAGLGPGTATSSSSAASFPNISAVISPPRAHCPGP